MNTKLLMTASALFMGAAGILLSFAPHEIMRFVQSEPGTISDGLALQITGALYFAFAMTNWAAKANLIGGIYGRPIAIGNLTHFTIGALALIKGCSSNSGIIIFAGAAVYTAFAVLFGVVFFRHPVKSEN